MPLFGFKKTAKTPPVAAPPSDKSIEDEIAEMERQIGVTNDKLGTEWGRKNSPSEDEVLERELEAMEILQNGKSRGGDRSAALRAMIQNSINQIKVLKQRPATPETLEAQKRLLEIAKKLNAELQELKKRGAKRKRATRRKRVTRRKRARQSS
jgi:hypothetical protein